MRPLSQLPGTPENEGAAMKWNEIPKTNFTMMKKFTLIMALSGTVFMAGMTCLINNPNDQKGIWLSGYGLNAENPVTHAGSPGCNQTDGRVGNMSSDTEARRFSGNGRPVILSLLTGLHDAGTQPKGIRMAPPTLSQLSDALHINRIAFSQRIAHGDSKVFSIADNPHVVEVAWLLACGVIGLAGLGSRRRE
jgi:hypothetical protein